jgi:histone-lysine N-methyltransferase SETMAR
MDKLEVRAVIKYFVLKGWKATQIHNDFKDTLGNSSPSLVTVSKWVNEFKRGRESLVDDPHSGRPKTATNSDMVEKVHKIVLEDCRLKVRQIAEMIDIPLEHVHHILIEDLGMKKLSARWVPRLLSEYQKQARVTMCTSNRRRLRRNRADFFASARDRR